MSEFDNNSEELAGEPLLDRRSFLIGALGLGGGAVIGYVAGQSDALPKIGQSIGLLSNEAIRPNSYEISTLWLPESVKRWHVPIAKAAETYKVDPDLIAIIMTVESGGYSKARSEADAKGLMQITPTAEQDIVARHLRQPLPGYDIWDPATNIEFGAAYMAYLRNEFGTPEQGPSWNDTAELIAAGYNGGPGAANELDAGRGLRSVETLQHSRDVLNMWRERHAASSPTYDRWLERGGSTLVSQAAGE
jgi:hypothetical protein